MENEQKRGSGNLGTKPQRPWFVLELLANWCNLNPPTLPHPAPAPAWNILNRCFANVERKTCVCGVGETGPPPRQDSRAEGAGRRRKKDLGIAYVEWYRKPYRAALVYLSSSIPSGERSALQLLCSCCGGQNLDSVPDHCASAARPKRRAVQTHYDKLNDHRDCCTKSKAFLHRSPIKLRSACLIFVDLARISLRTTRRCATCMNSNDVLRTIRAVVAVEIVHVWKCLLEQSNGNLI